MRPYIYAISGYKNSGKTTLMEGVIAELTRRGYRVATVKHDGHDFEPDVPETDSWKHHRAGAYGTAVFSDNRFMMTKECHGIDETALFAAFPEADIILIEGLKHSSYPKTVCSYPKEPLPDPCSVADSIATEMEKQNQ